MNKMKRDVNGRYGATRQCLCNRHQTIASTSEYNLARSSLAVITLITEYTTQHPGLRRSSQCINLCGSLQFLVKVYDHLKGMVWYGMLGVCRKVHRRPWASGR